MARHGRGFPLKPIVKRIRIAAAAGGSFLAGWATEANQVVTMLRKNVASQVVTFNFVNATTGAALTGATVTTKVTLDGTQGASAGTLTELGTGQYKYVPTQGETNGASVGFSFTATNAVPVNLHCFTIGQDPAATTLDVNVTKLLGTAWLTPGTAGTPDVNVKLWNALTTVELPLVPTTAGRKLDVSATGEAGVDWANVGSPTTALALTGTTIATTQKVDLETIKTQSVTAAAGVTFPTSIASPTNITAGTVTTATNVTTVNGLAANVITAASMAADAGAEIADAVWDEARAGHTSLGTFGEGVSTVQGNVEGDVNGNITGSVFLALNLADTVTVGLGGISASSFAAGAIDATAIAANAITDAKVAADVTIASVTGAVGSVTGNVGGNVVGSVASVTATVNADVKKINGTTIIGDGSATPWGP